MSKPKLFLIDANALCYRSFFAIKQLATSYGQATNAVYGFISTLKKILKDQPEYMAVCFDVGKKTRRHDKFAEYKMHRPAMPDDLVSQIPIIKEAVLGYNLPIFELEGFEADDVIATIAEKFKGEDLEIVIISGDKDMYQLVDKNVKVLNTHKDSLIGEGEVKELFGVTPNRMNDFIGLAGDKTDNIPGVNGIGDVTARELLKQFDSLEDIFKKLDQIKSESIRNKISTQKDQAIVSKELATLDTRVPIQFNLNDLKVTQPDPQKLYELFQKLEFRKLLEDLPVPQAAKDKIGVKTVNAASDIEELCRKIQKQGAFAFYLDINPEPEDSLFNSIGIFFGEKKASLLSVDKIEQLKSIFEDETIAKVGFDVKESLKVLFTRDIFMKGPVFDVMLAGYLLAPSQGNYDIHHLAWNYLKITPSAHDDDLAQKTSLVFDLHSVLLRELQEKSLLRLFEDIEIPLANVLAKMESEGVCIDEDLLKKLSDDCQKKIEDLIKKLYKLAGMEFNLNSPKQLSSVLFDKLKLPVVKKTKTGFSTDEGVLSQLAEKHELPALILEYRQLSKLKSTYIDALPRLVNRHTLRVHASFNQTGTETGRLSSNNPNLQNIPIRTELGREIRKAFIPSANDRVIISADYSQIELRILAHLSKDKNLAEAFQKNQDIHSFTASLIFEVEESQVTPAMRNTAKRVNFGIIYGMSAFGLAKDLGISQTEAQMFIDKYFLRYPLVKIFMEEEIKKAEKDGFVLTLLNRRRYLPEIKSANMSIRQFAQRQAINTPVQGSAADLIKLAMINIQAELEKKNLESKMIITVHDELVFDVTKKEEAAMIDLIRDKMEHPLALSVPIKVTIKIGKNWLEVKEV